MIGKAQAKNSAGEAMSADPRNANSLNEAALNPDGTYNGVKALSWLSAVLHPGKGLSESEVTTLAEEAKKRAAAKRNE